LEADVVAILEGLGDSVGRELLFVLAQAIDGLGEGVEFTGEELEKLGALAQALAAKVEAFSGRA
jgi:hypothetical protein